MAGDSNYANVSLHLPFNGPAGSTAHFDRAPTQKALTNSVGTALNTTQSKYNGTSLYLNGTNDTISTASHTDFNFGTGDFTIELWVYGTRTNQPHSFPRILANGAYLAANAWSLVLVASSGALFFDTYNGSAANGSSIGTLVENSWNHIAVTRQSGTLRTFLNGTLVTTKTDNQNLSGAYTTYVGSDTISFFKGYIDDLRITKGVARYTSNFTPEENQIGGLVSTDPHLANVKLLVNADQNPVVDKSPSARTLTFNGDAARSLVDSKFGPASLIFDGTDDFITCGHSVDLNLATDAFTIEAWIKTSTNTAIKYIVRKGSPTYSTGYVLALNASGKLFASIGVTTTDKVFVGATTVPINTWTHVAVTRSGSTIRLFINGVLDATGTLVGTPADNTELLYVGRDPSATVRDFNGYIDELRITKGVARYTSSFTVPTASFEEYTVVAETLTLTIPTSFSIYEQVTLSIATQFVVVDKYTLQVPTEFRLYETHTISVSTEFNVRVMLTLSLGTQFVVFDGVQMQVPLQITVRDATYTGSGESTINGSELNGSEINGEDDGAYLVTRLHLQTQFKVGEFLQLVIPTQFTVNPLLYSINIPTQFLIGAFTQLTIPTSFTVVSFPRSLQIPVAFVNYEVFDLSLSLQIVVKHPDVQLTVPTRFWMHEAYSLVVGTRFQVSPGFSSGTGNQGVGSVVHLPVSRSQEWSLQVMLRGQDVSHLLTGKISIDLEESSAAVAVFTLRLPDGIVDPYSWVKAPVSILYEDVSNGVSYLLYQGIVDTPAHNSTSNLTEFTCTDNLQNVIRKMTHAQVAALLPQAKWSRFVFDETADSWDYLQNLQETCPYAVHLDASGRLVSYNYQSAAIQYEFRDSVVMDGSLSIGLSNGREIVNQVNVSLDSQYDLYRESVAKIRWEGEIVIPLGTGAAIVWPCSANMPVDAIQGAGAVFLDDPLFGVQGGNRNVHGVNILNPGTELLIEAFQGLASKRFVQPITESRTFSVQNSASIAQIGVSEEALSVGIDVVYNESLSEAFTRVRVESKWLCSAGTSLQYPRPTSSSYLPSDPLLPTLTVDGEGVMITYPLYAIEYEIWDPDAIPNLASKAYHINEGFKQVGRPLYGEVLYDFDDYVIEGTSQDRSVATDVLVAQAIMRVLSTHRQNRLGFSSFINPLLERGQTIRIDTSKVKATGVIYQLQHVFDIDQGTAMTNVTLALSSSKSLGILDTNYTNLIFKLPTKFEVVDGSVASAVPVDNTTINYNQVLLQHVNENPDDFTYDNQHWGGFFTSYTATKYQEFIVEWPDIPEVNTANATVVSNGGIISVDVPNDEFYLIN